MPDRPVERSSSVLDPPATSNAVGRNDAPRILFAEDSTVIRAMVRKALEAAGYVVLEAANGQVAFDLCLQDRPDVALLDVEMPVLNGPQLLERLRADQRFADMPVIFLTGRTSTAEMVEGLRIGAHDYLRKPFEPAELIARVSAAVRVARLQQQLTTRNDELALLSRTDQLTGLSNRRHGEERLRAEIEAAQRYQRPLTVLMIDIDHFKHVNDRYGHAGGDAVLRGLGRRLRDLLRGADLAARWGGEEFVVLLPDTSVAGGAALAERLLETMRETPVVIDDQATADDRATCTVTVSIGAASSDETPLAEILRRADEALYRAKRAGRDRLQLAGPDGRPLSQPG
jgi:two-component system, cell cycle response regulator